MPDIYLILHNKEFFYISLFSVESHVTFAGGTKLHERFTESDSLPVVCTDENISANVHMLPINVRQNRSHQQIMQQTSNVSSMYPGNHRNGSSNSPKTQHINSLSISGMCCNITICVLHYSCCFQNIIL